MSQQGSKFSVIYFSFQLLVLLVIVLIAAEALVRKLAPVAAPGRRAASFSMPHSELGWQNRPGVSGEMLYRNAGNVRGVAVRVNSAGYRGEEPGERQSKDCFELQWWVVLPYLAWVS